MAVNEGSSVQAIINSNALKALGIVLTLVAAPVVVTGLIWEVSTLNSVNDRLGKLETAVNLSVPNIYPRGEAHAQFSQVNSAMAGVQEQLDDNTHRISALEDRRTALH